MAEIHMSEISSSERLQLENILQKTSKDLFFLKFETPFTPVGSFKEASFSHHKRQFHDPDIALEVSSL